MSSSGYCPGLQSCLEPVYHVEPRVLRLKLAPSKSNTSSSSTICKPFVANSDRDMENADTGGWSFLQCIANNTSRTATEENDKVYVPPNFKSSSSMLSEKSLEMCTEGLGSETGSEGSESSDGTGFLSPENVDYETRAAPKLRQTRTTRRTLSFPPPLSSIRGSNTVRVRPHREGGRLVLEAVTVSSCHVHLHAERTDGRLRLHLMKESSPDNFDNEEQEEEAEYGEEVSVQEDGAGDDEAEGGYDICGKELEGINGNSGGEMGMGKLASRRCKESGSSNESILNWEPFWVAT